MTTACCYTREAAARICVCVNRLVAAAAMEALVAAGSRHPGQGGFSACADELDCCCLICLVLSSFSIASRCRCCWMISVPLLCSYL
jgi:hypothetical protein